MGILRRLGSLRQARKRVRPPLHGWKNHGPPPAAGTFGTLPPNMVNIRRAHDRFDEIVDLVVERPRESPFMATSSDDPLLRGKIVVGGPGIPTWRAFKANPDGRFRQWDMSGGKITNRDYLLLDLTHEMGHLAASGQHPLGVELFPEVHESSQQFWRVHQVSPRLPMVHLFNRGFLLFREEIRMHRHSGSFGFNLSWTVSGSVEPWFKNIARNHAKAAEGNGIARAYSFDHYLPWAEGWQKKSLHQKAADCDISADEFHRGTTPVKRTWNDVQPHDLELADESGKKKVVKVLAPEQWVNVGMSVYQPIGASGFWQGANRIWSSQEARSIAARRTDARYAINSIYPLELVGNGKTPETQRKMDGKWYDVLARDYPIAPFEVRAKYASGEEQQFWANAETLLAVARQPEVVSITPVEMIPNI